jgi:O-antigen/teichoic acid export membrane protein
MRLKAKSDPIHQLPAADSFASGAARIAGAQVVRRAFRLAVLLIAARALGPAAFGVYTAILTVAELVAIFSGTGYSDYVTRHVARNGIAERQMLVRLAGLRSAYLAVAIGVATGLLWVLHFEAATVSGTALMGLALLPRTINELGQGIIRGHQRFSSLLMIEAVQGVVLVAGVLAFVSAGSGIRGIIFADIIATLAGACAALAVCLTLMSSAESESVPIHTLARATFAFNLYPLIVNVYDRADVLLLARLASDAAVGVYSLPYRVFATLQIVPYGMMGALLPRLSRTRWSAEAEQVSIAVLGRAYAIALFAILATMLLASPAVRLLLGPRYIGADTALKILIWAIIPVFFNSVFNTILLALNRERVFLITASVCTVVNIAANCVLIPLYSYRAAACVTVLTELVLLTQNAWFIRKAVGHVPTPPGIPILTCAFGVLCAAGMALQLFLPAWIVATVALLSFAALLRAKGAFAPFTQNDQVRIAQAEVRL